MASGVAVFHQVILEENAIAYALVPNLRHIISCANADLT